MEEAFTNLYKEFLRLQSICLKQAALLQQLTETIKRQQAVAAIPKADPELAAFVTCQCTKSSYPACHPATSPSAGIDSNALSVLAGGLNGLQLHVARPGDTRGKDAPKVATLGPLVSCGHNKTTAPIGGTSVSRQTAQHLRGDFNTAGGGITDAGGATSHAVRQELKPPPPSQMPWMYSSFINSEMLSQAGGLLMSEVTLHSQVCEFCQAVFPGNTTTIGEFLRHLTTHIT